MNWHIVLPLSVAFLLGICWRFFSRASKAFRSPLRTYKSRWDFVVTNWDVFLLRTVPFNSSFFALWLFKPGFLSITLTGVGVPASFANWLTVTPNLMSSFVFGFIVDYALDQLQLRLNKVDMPSWVPDALRDALRGEIPQYDQNAVNGAAVVQAHNRDIGLNP
jgi:hypothetical protein